MTITITTTTKTTTRMMIVIMIMIMTITKMMRNKNSYGFFCFQSQLPSLCPQVSAFHVRGHCCIIKGEQYATEHLIDWYKRTRRDISRFRLGFSCLRQQYEKQTGFYLPNSRRIYFQCLLFRVFVNLDHKAKGGKYKKA